jgi:hypothetical protein
LYEDCPDDDRKCVWCTLPGKLNPPLLPVWYVFLFETELVMQMANICHF